MSDLAAIAKSEFSDLMKRFDIGAKCAVAVSGGADSLALSYLMHQWCHENKVELIGLTVDHGLRPEAADEAKHVKSIFDGWNISHHTLTPDTPIDGTAGLQESARAARYDLMMRFCQEQDISTLFTAHHLGDQFETVLMRLARGSGVQGLSGIKPESKRGNISILRPLLTVSKARLIETCTAANLKWIEDPSNTDDTFMRVKLREAETALKEIGLTPETIEGAREKLFAAANFITKETHKELDKVAIKDGYDFEWDAFETYHPYLQDRLLSAAVQQIGQTDYPPRQSKLDTLLASLNAEKTVKMTLNHCVIEKTGDGRLKITAESV